MKLKYIALLLSVASAQVLAQEIKPVWVQHINGIVNVDPANVLPILNKPAVQPVIAQPSGVLRDGRESLAIYARLAPFDATRLILAISENGIDEEDPNLTQEQIDNAAKFPDHSLIYIDAATAKPLGIAW